MKSSNQSLKENLTALHELFDSIENNRKADLNLLSLYSGFGNIKEISLDPGSSQLWKNSNSSIREGIHQLHVLLKQYFPDEQNRTKILESLRSSTLTAYYTPESLTEAITSPILNSINSLNIDSSSIQVLEPSAGTGAFVPFLIQAENVKVTAVEKDIITSLFLEQIHGSQKVKAVNDSFESFINKPLNKNNRYDYIVSNIPFGSFKIFDPEYSRMQKTDPRFISQQKIHTYFFSKAIDQLSENGYLSFVTSTGILDSPGNRYLRDFIIRQCSLISAIRLPNNIFLDSGTKVNTDIIVLQKRSKPLKSLEDATVKEKKLLKTESFIYKDQSGLEIVQDINSFFHQNNTFNDELIGQPEIGYFHDKQQIVFSSNLSIDAISSLIHEKLSAALNNNLIKVDSSKIINPVKNTGSQQLNLFDDLFSSDYDKPITGNKSKEKSINQPASPVLLNEDLINRYHLIEGNVFNHNGITGRVQFTTEGPQLTPLTQQYNPEKITIAANILTIYKQLLHEDYASPYSPKAENLREQLNNQYDLFVSLFGSFSDRSNQDFKTLDVEGFKLQGLEKYDIDSKSFSKSDIFFDSIYKSEEVKNLTLEDHINRSLNNSGKINIEEISTITKMTVDQVISEGIEKRLFYFNPVINTNYPIDQKYRPSNDSFTYYFSTKDEFLSGPVRFKIAELEENKNTVLFHYKEAIEQSIELLKSVDNPYVNITELDVQLGENWVPIQYIQKFANELFQTTIFLTRSNSAEYTVKCSEKFNHINNREIAVYCKNGRTLTGDKLLREALHGTYPRITYSVGDKDNKVTYLDREAMSSAQMKIDQIQQKWREYVLSNPEVSSSLETIYNNTQNIDVERVYDGSHLKFHDMTHYTPLVHQKDAVWQMVVQNGGLVDHIVGAGKTLVMSALAMELNRLGTAKKVMIMAMKANTDQIAQDFRLAYPKAKLLAPTEKDFTPANRVQFLLKATNNNWDAIILTHEQFQSIPQSREMQIQILQEEIENLRLDLDSYLAERDGSGPNRRQIKGLQTRIENKSAQLESLNQSILKDPNLLTFDKMGVEHLIVDESQQFKNLEYTTRFDRVAGLADPEGSKRAFNLLLAVRTLQKFHGGVDKGITFCSGTTISNSLIELYLLKKYLRPNELRARQMPNFDAWARTHAKLARDYELSITNEVKPKERFRSFLKVPELARFYRSFTNIANENNIKLDKPDLDPIFVEVQPTETQKIFMEQIIKAIQNEDFSYFGLNLTENQLNAKMLVATSLATKVSLDVRLIDSSLSIEDGSKIIELTKNVSRIYRDSSEYKGTQFIFCDTSTPTSANASEFNIYQSIKDELSSKFGIPEDEIQFIHDFDSKSARIKLFNRVNSGDVRVVLGSTQKMGVGVNMQTLCVAMHHFDIPWTPKDLEQRNGRGSRQGNKAAKNYLNNKIPSFTYGTVGTLDAYKYFLVDIKHRFIQQIKTTNIDFRTLDEGDMDADGNMSPAAFIARLSGKEELLEKTKVDKRLADLEIKKAVLTKELSRCNSDIQKNTQLIPKIESSNEKFLIDSNLAKELFVYTEKKKLNYNLISPDGKNISDPELLKSHISKECLKFISNDPKLDTSHVIGHIGRFQFQISCHERFDEKKMLLEMKSLETENVYTFASSEFSPEVPGKQFRFPYDALAGIDHKIEKQIQWLKTVKEDLQNDTALLKKLNPNEFNDQITELRNRSQELAIIIEGQSAEGSTENQKIHLLINSLLESESMENDIKYLQEQFQSGSQINKEQIEIITKSNLSDEKKLVVLTFLNVNNPAEEISNQNTLVMPAEKLSAEKRIERGM